jgi:MFS family permease
LRVYACPALLDWILFLVIFAVSYGAGKRGMTMGEVAWLGGAMQVAYMLASVGSGFLLTRRNALGLLIASTIAAVAAAALCLVTRSFAPLLVWMAALGVSSAFFFNSFQSFMRGEAPPGGLARATALYTLAWSVGSSLGLISSGLVYELGRFGLIVVAAAVGGAIGVILWLHERRPHHEASAEEHTEGAPEGATRLHLRYVWVAWIVIFTAMFVQRPLLTFYPTACGRAGTAALLAALPPFLHMFIQGLGGLAMGRLRGWLYRPGPLVAVHLCAAAVLALMWLFPAYWVTAAGLSVLGLWGGFAYFCAVYYSGNAGHRSRNIGINECLVGLGSVAGLFICEGFIEKTNHVEVMYIVCALALGISALAAWAVGRTAASREDAGRPDGPERKV